MKPQELRLGNMVCPISRNTDVHMPMTLVHLQIFKIGLFESECVKPDNWTSQTPKEYSNTDLSPIPITEEWLEKLFEKENDCTWSDGDYLKFRFSNNTCFVFMVKSDEKDGNEWLDQIKIIQHVHQLQNLYFALTGEELTIKEKAFN